MFDGSHLPYEDNVEQTKEIVEYAHKRNIWVEAELGCLPGFEDFVFAEKAVYTNPKRQKNLLHLLDVMHWQWQSELLMEVCAEMITYHWIWSL